MKPVRPKILEVQRDDSIPWFTRIRKVVQFSDSEPPEVYHSIRPPDCVTVLARTREGEYLLVRQYRPAIEDFTCELPSGHIEDGETPTAAVVRELEEETQCLAGEVRLLGKLISDTGRSENRLWAFYAPEVTFSSTSGPIEGGRITVHTVSRDDLFRMIREGALAHALDLSVIALCLMNEYLET